MVNNTSNYLGYMMVEGWKEKPHAEHSIEIRKIGSHNCKRRHQFGPISAPETVFNCHKVEVIVQLTETKDYMSRERFNCWNYRRLHPRVLYYFILHRIKGSDINYCGVEKVVFSRNIGVVIQKWSLQVEEKRRHHLLSALKIIIPTPKVSILVHGLTCLRCR